ncbi:MAG: DUF305 domain-containing protein [Cytophagales bacterium]|nr:DUF305 domain-containing protein [Armatimonadota bacterium]
MIHSKWFSGTIPTVAVGFGLALALGGCANPAAVSDSASSAVGKAGDTGKAGDAGHSTLAGHGGHQGHEAAMAQGRTMDHAMGTSGMESLQKLSGREFDIAFLSQMIAHHEAAVVMAEQALKTAKETATRQEARQVVTAQTREITQMTGWLEQWYGVPPSKAQQALVNADMKSMMAMPVTADKLFYERMIPHHQGAIDTSELALTRASRSEAKTLARQILRDQKAEIAAYRKWLGNSAR